MTITIRSRNATWDLTPTHGDRILYAGLAASLPLPYECASGTCGTCKARIKKGDFTDLWPDAPGRSNLKADKGEFLMCQCIANGDIEILVPGHLQDQLSGPVPVQTTGILSFDQKLVADVATFTIQLEQPLSFDPGQFVVVQLPGIDGYRAYSMTNFAQDTRSLNFVIKHKPAGGVSNWLFADDANDCQVKVFGPLGQATFRTEEDKDVLCIAGGSGIAGMMSILRAAVSVDYFKDDAHHGHVFFGVRTMDDLFFADELRELGQRSAGKLRITIALSDEESGAQEMDQTVDGVSIARGFVHTVARERICDSFNNAVAYVAGPPPMVDGALRMLITEAKFSPEHIRYDKFN